MTTSAEIERWLTRMFSGRPRPASFEMREMLTHQTTGALVMRVESNKRRWIWQPSVRDLAEKFDKAAQRDVNMTGRGRAYVITMRDSHGVCMAKFSRRYEPATIEARVQ